MSEVPNIDILWDYTDPAASEGRFRKALSTENNHDASMELLTQIARALGLQQKFDEAHRTLDEVEAKLESTTPLVRARYLLERGRAFNSSGQKLRAIKLFTDAFDLARANALDYFAVDALHMLAIAEPDAARQLEHNFKAMQLAEASTDERARGWLATLYNNIGWTYYEQKRYDEGLELFRKAIPLREKAAKPEPLRVAHYSVGKTLRALGKLDEALAIQLKQHQLAEEAKAPDGYICEEIAECLLAQGKVAESKPYFARAFELLRDDIWLKRDEPQRLERLDQLSK